MALRRVGDREPDEDDIPDTPLDEPPPEPIQDPPAEPGPQGPYIVGGGPRWFVRCWH